MPRFVCIRARLARHHSPRAFGDYRPSCVVGRWSRLRRFDMGSWDEKPFGNDTALDWLAGLEESRDISYLANTINRISPSSDLVSSALTLLQRIVADSELRQLWQESGSIAQWLKKTNAVIGRLRNA